MHNAICICSRLIKRRLSPTVTSELSPPRDFSEAHFRLYHRRSFAAIKIVKYYLSNNGILHYYPYVIHVAIVQNACIRCEKQSASSLSSSADRQRVSAAAGDREADAGPEPRVEEARVQGVRRAPPSDNPREGSVLRLGPQKLPSPRNSARLGES